MPPDDEHTTDRADRLAEIDEWLTDLEPGCDGWYIPVALVRWLRDEVERQQALHLSAEGIAKHLSDYLDRLSVENARLRAQIEGTVDD